MAGVSFNFLETSPGFKNRKLKSVVNVYSSPA